MQPNLSLACFLSVIRPPGIQFEDAMLQILPVDKAKCPFVRDKSDIEFRLFTRHNPTVYQELRIDDDEALFASHFDFHAPTVIYFGAFMEGPDESSGLLIRQSYMLKGDSNFVILDLSRLEAGPWYFTAAENTWYIGNFAARFIDYMVTRGLNLNTTHLIGHSLGAQSAGVAGHAIKSGRVSRITGLDPALPLFNNLPLPQRLDPSDGQFVDIIHTDAGIFGYKAPIGHVDFYPNGGISPQPGCELEMVLFEQRLLNKFFCSHWRSYEFYSESVLRPRAFVASSCGSWRQYKRGLCAAQHTTHMGYGVDRTVTLPPVSECSHLPRRTGKKLDSYSFSSPCDSCTHGFCVFHLQPNKNLSFIDKLQQFFTYISTINESTEDRTPINFQDSTNDNKEKTSKSINMSKDKLLKYTNSKKNNVNVKSPFITKMLRVNDKVDDDNIKLTLENNDKTIDNKSTVGDTQKLQKNKELDESLLITKLLLQNDKKVNKDTENDHSHKEIDNTESMENKELYTESPFITKLLEINDKNVNKDSKNNHNYEEIDNTEAIDQFNIGRKTLDHTPKNQIESYKREKRIIKPDNINSLDNSIVTNTNDNETIANTPTTLHKDETHDSNIHRTDTEAKSTNIQDVLEPTTEKIQAPKRTKRFISLFRNNENDNFLIKMLEFLVKNRKNVIPVVTVMREINTLVKSANGELNHVSKVRNNYIGGLPTLTPIKYDLELGESGIVSFIKKLFGIAPRGGKLSITESK